MNRETHFNKEVRAEMRKIINAIQKEGRAKFKLEQMIGNVDKALDVLLNREIIKMSSAKGKYTKFKFTEKGRRKYA